MMFASDLGVRMNKMVRPWYTIALLLGLVLQGTAAQAASQSDDRWSQIKWELFGDKTLMDGADVIALDTPVRAQDAAVVPVGITAKIRNTADRYIHKLYLVIENNPSPVAAVFEFPGDRPWQTISTRVRVNAYTNVRVLAQLNTGETYMTTNFVKASGGCSAPALKDAAAAAAQIGRMKLLVPASEDGARTFAKLLIKHPNSSGLQFDQVSRNYIPAHYVRNIEVRYQERPLFKVATDISISEDPAISFDFLPKHAVGELEVRVTDSKGREFEKMFELAPAG